MESLEEWLTRPEGVATRLRALRVQAGLSGKRLADTNSWAQSKVSRIETGKQPPSNDDIDAWIRTCGVSDADVAELRRLRDAARSAQVSFRSRMRQGQEKVQESYKVLIKNAHFVRYFETAFIPGLLQVPDYARRVFTEMVTLHDLEIDDVDAAVANRMQWQQMLYDPNKKFEFLIGESALRWHIVPPAVMRAQLDRLQTVIGLERVRFGILPMQVQLSITPQNSFQIYEADEPLATVETFIGEKPHWGEEASAYERVMDRLWDEAVTGEQARQLLISATQALGSSDD